MKFTKTACLIGATLVSLNVIAQFLKKRKKTKNVWY